MRTTQSYALRDALARVRRDARYRAHVIEDGRRAQAEAGLGDEDWHALLGAALARDAEVRFDPAQPTEVDHGEADAAGAKN